MFQVLFKMHVSYLNKTKLAALITAEIGLLYSEILVDLLFNCMCGLKRISSLQLSIKFRSCSSQG